MSQETWTEEVARLRLEIAVRQIRLQHLVLGDPSKGVSLGRPLPVVIPEELVDDLKAAVERQENDTRTPEQQIEDGVAFVMDTRLGGY